jgi:hypothetical protein
MLKKGGALPTQKQRFCLAKNAPADLLCLVTSCHKAPAHLHVRRDNVTACFPPAPRGGGLGFFQTKPTMWKV